ncbi:Rho termination factor N-terminal domain-containing protein [Faecalimicrobium sp. JNUCC 81]
MEVPQNINYSELKVDELKAIAKEKGLEGYSSMTKAELIELIEKA